MLFLREILSKVCLFSRGHDFQLFLEGGHRSISEHLPEISTLSILENQKDNIFFNDIHDPDKKILLELIKEEINETDFEKKNNKCVLKFRI